MPPRPTKHIQTRRGDNVRIGPISIITLIIVVCMAVMGVLAISTANATETVSGRQATATERLYLNERAGQEFVAEVDAVLAKARGNGDSGTAAARSVKAALDGICEKARAAVDNRVDCTADVSSSVVTAEFVCEDTRLLNIAITIQGDASYRITEWKMTSAQQDAATTGNLWAGA